MQGPMSDPRPAALLTWYDRHRRVLPWRAAPGATPDPYRVWLAEIMLQQTTVAAVIPYFERFVARWPTVGALAAAADDDVLAAWAGLGYYARARRLIACARAVAARGGFPETEADLRALPGIGAYTAAAIAAIAFGRPAAVVDGNVQRVMARLFAVAEPLPRAKPILRAHAARLTPDRRPGDYAQAVMDLGATVCVPRTPRCAACPWSAPCRARAEGEPARYPIKTPRAPRTVRHGVAFVLTRPDGALLLRRRPPEGLLGGMTEVPSTPWRAEPWTLDEARTHAPAACRWRALGRVEHTFTHFHLVLEVVAGRSSRAAEGFWRQPDELPGEALPSVMRKITRLIEDAQ